MIKFIASDMDGTLVDDNKILSPEIFDVIEKLKQKGVCFAAASGRQSMSLYRSFQKTIDDMFFIAENGAFVSKGKKEVYSSVMPKDLVNSIIGDVRNLKKAEPLLCGKYCAYTTKPKFVEIMESDLFRYDIKLVDSLEDVEDDIIKVSVLDWIDVKQNTIKTLSPKYSDKTEITISGENCVDFVNKGVSKGRALKEIQEVLNIPYESTVAFGDNFNDTEMLKQAYYSFAMENADDEVKSYARFIAGNNNDGAVIKEIKRLCDL